VVGVPALQRLLVGALLTVVPLADPHVPTVEVVPDELLVELDEAVPEELEFVPELELVELDVVPELELVEVPLELVLTVPELLDPVTIPLELDVLLPELELVELDVVPELELVLEPLDDVIPELDPLELELLPAPVLCPS
jgi:hypothetical protein